MNIINLINFGINFGYLSLLFIFIGSITMILVNFINCTISLIKKYKKGNNKI